MLGLSRSPPFSVFGFGAGQGGGFVGEIGSACRLVPRASRGLRGSTCGSPKGSLARVSCQASFRMPSTVTPLALNMAAVVRDEVSRETGGVARGCGLVLVDLVDLRLCSLSADVSPQERGNLCES
jgi:hypothetical protein